MKYKIISIKKNSTEEIRISLTEYKGTDLKETPPVLIGFDPMGMFSASERAVNDNEQALVRAARRIIRGLNCCVRYIHHTGQTVARGKLKDQYAGRGGSARSMMSDKGVFLSSSNPAKVIRRNTSDLAEYTPFRPLVNDKTA